MSPGETSCTDFFGFRRGTGGGLLFFFQAEDGIRDLTVTGVQTCALPIFDVGRHEASIPAGDESGEIAAVEADDRIGDAVLLVLLVHEPANATIDRLDADALDDLGRGSDRLSRIDRETRTEPE